MKYPEVKLSDAFWFQEGPGVRKWQFKSQGVKLLNVGNILKNGAIDLEKTDRHLAVEEVERKYSHFLADAGDLVIASSGITIDNDGLLRTRGAFIEQQHLPLCMNTSTIRFKPVSEVSDLRFLRHWLDSIEFRTQITREVTGIAQKNFGPSHLKRIRLRLPPLPEQKRIAAILDAADALRAKRRESIKQLDALIQSTFIEMFGDARTNSKQWPTRGIGETLVETRSGASIKPDEFESTGHPVLHKGAIKALGQVDIDAGKKTHVSHDYAASKAKSLVDRSFTAVTLRDLVPTGPSIGLAANLARGPHDEYLLSQGAYGLRFDEQILLPDYFAALTNEPSFRGTLRRYAVGSTQIHIRLPVLLKIEMPVPPVELQAAFVKIIDNAEHVSARLIAHDAELNSLFASLESRAFAGEL